MLNSNQQLILKMSNLVKKGDLNNNGLWSMGVKLGNKNIPIFRFI